MYCPLWNAPPFAMSSCCCERRLELKSLEARLHRRSSSASSLQDLCLLQEESLRTQTYTNAKLFPSFVRLLSGSETSVDCIALCIFCSSLCRVEKRAPSWQVYCSLLRPLLSSTCGTLLYVCTFQLIISLFSYRGRGETGNECEQYTHTL